MRCIEEANFQRNTHDRSDNIITSIKFTARLAINCISIVHFIYVTSSANKDLIAEQIS